MDDKQRKRIIAKLWRKHLIRTYRHRPPQPTDPGHLRAQLTKLDDAQRRALTHGERLRRIQLISDAAMHYRQARGGVYRFLRAMDKVEHELVTARHYLIDMVAMLHSEDIRSALDGECHSLRMEQLIEVEGHIPKSKSLGVLVDQHRLWKIELRKLMGL